MSSKHLERLLARQRATINDGDTAKDATNATFEEIRAIDSARSALARQLLNDPAFIDALARRLEQHVRQGRL